MLELEVDKYTEENDSTPQKQTTLYFERDWIFIASLLFLALTTILSWVLFVTFTISIEGFFLECGFFEAMTWYFFTLFSVPPVISFTLLVNLFYLKMNNIGNRWVKHLLFVLHVIGNIITLVSLIILIIISIMFWQRTAPISQWEGTLKMPNLLQDVIIKRNEKGIFTIEAQTESDMMYAQGFVTAQNRLWQLEMQRRVGRGILSEIVGSGGLEIDKTSRTLGFFKAAEKDILTIAPRVRQALERYTSAINDYIDSKPSLPFEFWIFGTSPQKYEPVDVLTWGKLISFDLSENSERELIRYQLYQKYNLQKVLDFIPKPPSWANTILNEKQVNITLLQAEIDAIEASQYDNSGAYKPKADQTMSLKFIQFLKRSTGASNNWVVSGSKSSTGKPILVNDPHLLFTSPSIWNFVHMKCPTIELTGVALTGVPGIMIGRNQHIAWGITNVGADVQDLYVMKETNGGNSYIYKNQERNYGISEEIIKVSGEADVVIKVKRSIYGPVVNDIFGIKGESLSLKWITIEPNDTLSSAFLSLCFAKNWNEFRSSVSQITAPSCNVIYADNQGNIGYQTTGKIPIRKIGHTGMFPVVGDGTWDYEGEIPFDKLPSVFNPPEGFISSANNRVTPPGYPYIIAHDWEPPFRDMRIKEFLSQPKVGIDDMKLLLMDTKSIMFEQFKFVFFKITVKNDAWLKTLQEWNGVSTMESREAYIWEHWREEMKKITVNTYDRSMRDPIHLYNILSDPIRCSQYDCLKYSAEVFDKVIDNVNGNLPAWGDVHLTKYDHMVFVGTPLECFASRSVSNWNGYENVNVGNGIENTDGPSYRQIINFADLSESLYIFGPGTDGHIFSQNYASFLQDWRDGNFFSMKNSSEFNKILILTK